MGSRAQRGAGWVARGGIAAVCVGMVHAPTEAHAVGVPTIYDNHTTYPIGSRAAGMAGAYTSLGCDEAALFYNPAALACASASRLELAANAYVIQHTSVPDAFGTGQNLSSTNYHSVPSIVSGVRILADGDPETRAGRWVFGFSVAVPKSIFLQVDPAEPDNPNSITASVRDALTTADVGLGWQITPVIAVGFSLGAMLRTYEASFATLYVARSPVLCGPAQGFECNEFLFDYTEEEALAVGGRAKAAVRITPDRNWAIGLNVESPSLNVFGSSSVRSTTTFGVESADDAGNVGSLYSPVVFRAEGGSSLGWPMRIAAGASYSSRPFSIALDVSVNLPTEAAILQDVDTIDIDGLPDAGTAQDVIVKRDLQPNVALGAEVEIVRDVVVDFGGFTDLSSVSQEEVDAAIADRVHMFGGTAAIGLLGEQARGYFGLGFKIGQGETAVPGSSFDLDTLIATDGELDGTATITRWTLAGFIGSNYSFYGDDEE